MPKSPPTAAFTRRSERFPEPPTDLPESKWRAVRAGLAVITLTIAACSGATDDGADDSASLRAGHAVPAQPPLSAAAFNLHVVLP